MLSTSGRRPIGGNVFDAAVGRLTELYKAGHRLVISFSAGKDSGVVLELAVIAARAAGRLPVEVVMRDEEILMPGTFEYAERVAQRPEIDFHWMVAHQPIVNIFNRREPYFWVFDQQLKSSDWVRSPPAFAETIGDQNIERMISPLRFPVQSGQRLFSVVGMRVQESRARRYGIFAAKGYITKPNKHGVSKMWPIYDWLDTDVWRGIQHYGWDYNHAYNTMRSIGIHPKNLRIGPPTMSLGGARILQLAAKAWPRWFDKVCTRLHGVRAVTLFGAKTCEPSRRLKESWESVFRRECLETDIPWIRERSERAMKRILDAHGQHATGSLPDIAPCIQCSGALGSWKALAVGMYNGDPFALKFKFLKYVEPEFFRAGAGTWNGTPAF